MAADPFASFARTPTQCADNAFEITPDDDEDLSVIASALYVGSTGSIALTTAGGDEVTFTNVAGGAILPVRAVRVFETGTTAEGIIGLY